MGTTITVQAQRDYIAALSNASPILALTELIWNALDADAFDVKIDLIQNPLGGVEAIRVSDDGLGIDLADNGRCFGNLGGSWKRTASATPLSARVIHGQKGKGRFKAFALGNHVTWQTTSQNPDGGLQSWTIEGDLNNPGTFNLSRPASTGPAPGTEVLITNISKDPLSLLDTENAIQQLAAQFALYLKAYPNVHIWFRGLPVDPAIVQERATHYTLSLPNGTHTTVEVIEWKSKKCPGKIVFCDNDGFALHEIEAGIRPGKSFSFTAYLISPFFKQLHEESILTLDEMHPEVRRILEQTRDLLRAHFQTRKTEKRETLLSQWKQEQIYPYPEEEHSLARKSFDLCALAIRAASPTFTKLTPLEKQLLFRLLKDKVESAPAEAVDQIGQLLGIPLKPISHEK